MFNGGEDISTRSDEGLGDGQVEIGRKDIKGVVVCG